MTPVAALAKADSNWNMTNHNSRERLLFLDVARGVAALLVLVCHTLCARVQEYLPWAIDHVEVGRVGVILFLLISGYIIPVSLQEGGSNARFWLRRCFRLLPLYWCSILLAFGCRRCGIMFITPVPASDHATWLCNLTMLQGLLGYKHVLGVFWTLHMELMIYCACSLLFCLRLLDRPWLVASLSFAAFAIYRVVQPYSAARPIDIGGDCSYYLAALIGMMANHLSRERNGNLKLGLLMLGHLFLVGRLTDYRSTIDGVGSDSFVATACNWGTAYALFLCIKAMRHPPMMAIGGRLGVISYSVYLLHMFVLATLHRTQMPMWGLLPCLAVGVLAVSEFTYRVIERPGIRLGRRLECRLWPLETRVAEQAPVRDAEPATGLPARRAA
jgi:peptidoglycan/LPS O-acetylase OafA/YrhL